MKAKRRPIGDAGRHKAGERTSAFLPSATITCMPAQLIAVQPFQLPILGRSIMPDGFLEDTGFLPPPADIPTLTRS